MELNFLLFEWPRVDEGHTPQCGQQRQSDQQRRRLFHHAQQRQGGFFLVQLFLFHRFRLLVTGHFTTERKRQIDCRPVDDPFAADGQRRCSVRRRPGGRVAPPTKSLHFPARDAFRRRTGRTKKRANEETPSSAHFMDHVASSFFNNNKKDPSFSPVRPSLCTFLIQIFFLIFSI